jgi:hypothetical protein
MPRVARMHERIVVDAEVGIVKVFVFTSDLHGAPVGKNVVL